MSYNVVLVSAIQQHRSALSIRMSPPSHLPTPPHPTPLGCHRAPGLSSLQARAPCQGAGATPWPLSSRGRARAHQLQAGVLTPPSPSGVPRPHREADRGQDPRPGLSSCSVLILLGQREHPGSPPFPLLQHPGPGGVSQSKDSVRNPPQRHPHTRHFPRRGLSA